MKGIVRAVAHDLKAIALLFLLAGTALGLVLAGLIMWLLSA